MKLQTKIFLSLMLATLMVLSLSLSAFALPINSSVVDGYTYNKQGQTVPAPAAYRTVAVKGGRDFNISTSFEPIDMCVQGNNLYILDRASNRVVVLDSTFHAIKVINKIVDTPDYEVPDIDYISYNEDGTTTEDPKLKKADKYSFNRPQGIYVDENGKIFVADTDNRRIVVMDIEGNCSRVYQSVRVSVLGNDFVFKPLKVLVDNTGFINVTAYGVNKGLMRLNTDGSFDSFFAQPTVKGEGVDIIGNFASEISGLTADIKQAAYEYSSLARDSAGFIYVTAFEDEDAASIELQKLNSAGKNVLTQSDFITEHGFGDVQKLLATQTTESRMVDVALNEEAGTYTLLDAASARFFTYSDSGMLLFVGGGEGSQFGRLAVPASIVAWGDYLIVGDTTSRTITVYEQTDYAKSINRAFESYKKRDYETAAECWKTVSQYNSLMYLSFQSLGNIDLITGRDLEDDDPMKIQHFTRALRYFTAAQDPSGYSDAYGELRDAQISKYFNLLFGTVILVGVGMFVSAQVRKVRQRKAERKRRLGV